MIGAIHSSKRYLALCAPKMVVVLFCFILFISSCKKEKTTYCYTCYQTTLYYFEDKINMVELDTFRLCNKTEREIQELEETPRISKYLDYTTIWKDSCNRD